MELRRLALSGALWTGAGTALSAAIQFLQIAVLARLLQPADFGLMALVYLVIGFAQAYADAGMSGAIVHRQDTRREVLSSLFWVNVVCGMGIFLVLSLTSPLLGTAFSQPELPNLITLASFSFLLTPASQQYYALLQKSFGFAPLAAIDVLTTIGTAAAAIALAYLGYGAYSLVWGHLCGTTVRAAALIGFGLREWKPQFRVRLRELKGYLRFGAFQMMERTVNFLGRNLDKLFIGSLIGVHELGLYSVAYQIVMKPMQFVTPIVNRVALPVFAKVQTDDARLRAGFLDSIRMVATVLFPVNMGIILLADPLVLVVLGADWRPVVPVLQILSVLGFFYGIGNPIGSLLVAKGRVGLSFLLNVWLVTLYASAISFGATAGVEGIATALVIATAFGLFPVGFWIRWLLVRMKPLEYVAALFPALAGSLIMAVCILSARAALPFVLPPIADLFFFTIAGAVSYVLVIVPWQWAFIARLTRLRR